MDYTTVTREHFINIYKECISEIESEKVRVNDKEEAVKMYQQRIEQMRKGENDHTFTFQQMKQYFITGECVALLP